jgi:hypothetical protein
MIWTDERVDQLKALWKEHSASEIARLFNASLPVESRTTRNAIIGKAHRLGLPAKAVSRRYHWQPPREARA